MLALAYAMLRINTIGLSRPDDDGRRFAVAGSWGFIIFGKREMFGVVVLFAMLFGGVIGGVLPMVWVSTAVPATLDRAAQVIGALAGVVIAVQSLSWIVRAGIAVVVFLVVGGILSVPYHYIRYGDLSDKSFAKILGVVTWPLSKSLMAMQTTYQERGGIKELTEMEMRYPDGLANLYGKWQACDNRGRLWTVQFTEKTISIDEPGYSIKSAAAKCSLAGRSAFCTYGSLEGRDYEVIDKNTLARRDTARVRPELTTTQ